MSHTVLVLLFSSGEGFTLLCNLNLSAPEVGLLDVFDAEVSVALGVLLLFVPRRCLIVRAVCVWRRYRGRNKQNTDSVIISVPVLTGGPLNPLCTGSSLTIIRPCCSFQHAPENLVRTRGIPRVYPVEQHQSTNTTCGVPQGSDLEPPLFHIYMLPVVRNTKN